MRRLFTGDPWIWALGLAATVVGILAIWDSGYTRSAAVGGVVPREAITQSVAAFVALLAALAASRLRPAAWKDLAWPSYFLGLGGLLAVKAFGKEINGAQRWIELGPFNLQPSEFAKVAIVLFLAVVFAARPAPPAPPRRQLDWADSIRRVWVPRLLRAWPLLFVGAYVLLIEFEPDLATAMVVAVVSGAMLVLGGISTRSLTVLGVSSILVVGVLVGGQSYRMDRILHHGDRWAATNMDSIGYQTTQSEVAMARGGLFGVGLGEGRAKHTLPAPTTDFVMTTVAEETGLVGCLIVLSLVSGLAGRLYFLGTRSKDRFARLTLAGIGLWIGIQTCTNMMMANGFVPPIGVPMPFVSAGGSSLIALWLAIGVCQSVLSTAAETAKDCGRSADETRRDRWRNRRPRISRA